MRVPFRHVGLGTDRLLVIGADITGRLLEVVVLDPEGNEPVIIHADIMREKFYDFLK